MKKKYVYSFTCDEPGCNKTYSSHSGYKIHKLKHAGEYPSFHCDVEGCDKSFWSNIDRERHKRFKHTHEKPFVCSHCQRAFVLKVDLDQHVRTHTGDRPYVCAVEDCGASFAQSGTLRAHERTHTKNKPFVCDYEDCGKAFTVRTALNVHKRKHTGEKPYICDVCAHASLSSGNLQKHIQSMHTETYNARRKIQEENVRKALLRESSEFSGWEECFLKGDSMPPIGQFRREKRIDFSCVDSSLTYCMIDFVLSTPSGYIFLEVDESQHRFGYDNDTMSCDMKRMAKVSASLLLEFEHIPNIYWLRYNPHAWRIDDELQSVPKSEREDWLLRFVSTLTFTQPLTVAYAFYDVSNGELEAIHHHEYHPEFRRVAVNVTSWHVSNS